MKSSIAIAALVAASLGVASVAPVSAQTTSSSAEASTTASSSSEPMASTPAPTAPANADTAAPRKPMHPMQGMRKPAMAGGARQMIFDLTCSDRGPAVVEHMLDRMEKNLQLNADQTKLFTEFKAKALTSETTFADACQAARPAPTAGTRPTVIDQLKSQVAVDTARLTALNDMLPPFEAFFNSLTDKQKADLFPRHGMGMGMERHNQRGPGTDRQARPMAPGR